MTLWSSYAYSQGCVAVRSYSSCTAPWDTEVMAHEPAPGTVSPDTGPENPGRPLFRRSYSFSLNYRYYNSFRHFKGTVEQTERLEENTEVINDSHAFDLGFSAELSRRFSMSLVLPFAFNYRSSLYEHGRTERHGSSSKGLGDIRLTGNYLLLDPASSPGGNILMSFGIKFPTGNDQAEDYFYNVGAGGQGEVRPVDQSVQLGDGGWGLMADMHAFRKISARFSGYGSFYYMFTPQDKNGTRTYRETLSASLANESEMGIADQYMARAGVHYQASAKLSASLGGRFECVPARDLIGESKGFRRPGYILSVDPGLNVRIGPKLSASLNVPIALERNRMQSLTDKETERLTGVPRQGDAAFADYAVYAGFSYRL